MIKAILWDFDGVIADSVNVKTEAFYDMYLPYGKEVAENVKKYHLANGGVSRFKKFEYFQTELLGEPYPVPKEKINSLANKFSKLVLEKVVAARYITGVDDVLKKYAGIVDNYIVSGTPTEEMQTIIRKRNLSPYFKKVYGSPKNKNQLSDEIIAEYGYAPHEIIFIGDALSDYNAAIHCGTHFILRRHADNVDVFSDYHSYSIDDFTNFDNIFQIINQQQ